MKKKLKLKQYDVEDALKGKESFVENDDEEEIKLKKLGLFDFVNDIRKTKSGTLLDKEENISAWNSYMIIQALSMKLDDVEILNYFNKFTSTMSKKAMYESLLYWIAKDPKFYKWIGKESTPIDNETVESVSKYFECSTREAKDYIDVMGDEWAENIKNKY